MFNSAAVFDPSEGTSKRSEKERPNDFPLHQIAIAIIDMDTFLSDSELCRQNELEKLGIACQQWGFFQAVNHGSPVSMMERMKKIVREFVQLPLEEKLKYEMQEAEGYGQLFVASDDQVLNWSDIVFLTSLPTENRKMKFWPTTPADFRETAIRMNYYPACPRPDLVLGISPHADGSALLL
ncbi:hypothetical protein SUGI_0545160 [Cryptomeria japonica]|nr:hypothetical protein SUGI_0545160 [Cryptomeria japonica]